MTPKMTSIYTQWKSVHSCQANRRKKIFTTYFYLCGTAVPYIQFWPTKSKTSNFVYQVFGKPNHNHALLDKVQKCITLQNMQTRWLPSRKYTDWPMYVERIAVFFAFSGKTNKYIWANCHVKRAGLPNHTCHQMW